MALVDKYAGKTPNKGLIAKYVGKERAKDSEKPPEHERATHLEKPMR